MDSAIDGLVQFLLLRASLPLEAHRHPNRDDTALCRTRQPGARRAPGGGRAPDVRAAAPRRGATPAAYRWRRARVGPAAPRVRVGQGRGPSMQPRAAQGGVRARSTRCALCGGRWVRCGYRHGCAGGARRQPCAGARFAVPFSRFDRSILASRLAVSRGARGGRRRSLNNSAAGRTARPRPHAKRLNRAQETRG
jgi:hypothetical protein